MQSTLVRVGRLGRNCDYEGIHFDHESYEQPSPPSTIHPALFSLEDRITHGGQVPSNRTPIEVYADGSKISDQMGSAFCVIANEVITKTWKAKLNPANTVFPAEMLALKAAIEWANTANEDVNIWSDSESSLQALKSLNLSLSRWQAEWDNGETGRSVCSIIPKISNKQLHWSRECIQFATGHGPFPSYLKRFGLHSTDNCRCGEIGNSLHYATRCPPTLSYHHKEPSPQFIVHWWKSALSRKPSRRNIDNLITFLATHEDLIKRQNSAPSHSCLEIDTSKDSPPRTRSSKNSQLSSKAH
ncbi:hypothetical protein AVEN_198475-1 [Araneus ventricosus]|uniref:Uncharacterized protein n=1 Tax=Araneus ventricosus TaxID=182803 RepID=A0A4Y2U6I6_ARAVE|nr:hypothetical protein AVEN_198475-1 [Araneus ventricosus]